MGFHTTNAQLEFFRVFVGSQDPNLTVIEQLDLTRDIYEELNKQQKDIFNILLPVFSVWVGAIITYFFGLHKRKKEDEEEALRKKSSNIDNSMNILRERFAKGEIDEDEYKRRKELLD